MDMSQHFTTRQLIRYTLPTMAMLLFTSIYGIVDGFFISNFAGKTAFAAGNIIWPFIMILGTVGFMMGTGGSALVATTRGEGDDARANAYFSMIVCFTVITGVLLSAIGAAVMEPVSLMLGASTEMLDSCIVYGMISMISLPAFMLQFAFQALMPTAGKPELGLYITVAAGIANMVLDCLFVGVFGWGIAGAAWATVISEFVGGLTPLVYFARENSSALRLVRPSTDMRALGKACVNGSSEMMTNIAMSVVSIVYNLQLMSYLGEDGVAAYGALMYASMIFGAVLMGYCMGSAPLMSFQHGAENDIEKRSIFHKSVAAMVLGGLLMFLFAEALAYPIALVFASYDEGLLELTVHAFRIYAIASIFMGLNMYGSSLFTALGNGLVSAIIAFVRTLVFEVGAVLLLPMFVGADGIWFSVTVAELASLVLTVTLVLWLGPNYGIIKRKVPELA